MSCNLCQTHQWRPPRRDPTVTRCLYLKPEDPKVRARREARRERNQRIRVRFALAGLRNIVAWIGRRRAFFEHGPWERLAVESLRSHPDLPPPEWRELLMPAERVQLGRLREDIERKRRERYLRRTRSHAVLGVQVCIDNVRLRAWRSEGAPQAVLWTPLAPGFSGAVYLSKAAAVAAVRDAKERALSLPREWCAP